MLNNFFKKKLPQKTKIILGNYIKNFISTHIFIKIKWSVDFRKDPSFQKRTLIVVKISFSAYWNFWMLLKVDLKKLAEYYLIIVLFEVDFFPHIFSIKCTSKKLKNYTILSWKLLKFSLDNNLNVWSPKMGLNYDFFFKIIEFVTLVDKILLYFNYSRHALIIILWFVSYLVLFSEIVYFICYLIPI